MPLGKQPIGSAFAGQKRGASAKGAVLFCLNQRTTIAVREGMPCCLLL